jgi:hypothetical protein
MRREKKSEPVAARPSAMRRRLRGQDGGADYRSQPRALPRIVAGVTVSWPGRLTTPTRDGEVRA